MSTIDTLDLADQKRPRPSAAVSGGSGRRKPRPASAAPSERAADGNRNHVDGDWAGKRHEFSTQVPWRPEPNRVKPVLEP